MSVKLIPGLTPEKTDHIQKIGGICYSPPHNVAVPCDTIKSNKVRIDIASIENIVCNLYDAGEDVEDNILCSPPIIVDFGYVIVDSSRFIDVTFADSRPGAPSLYPIILIPADASQSQLLVDNVFRIISPDSNDQKLGLRKLPQTKNLNEFKYRIVFSPKIPGINSLITFKVKAGQYGFCLQCKGCSEGPAVHFSQNVVNLGGLFYGSESKTSITVFNFSRCPAHFQFDVDNFRSVFKICPVSATLAPASSIKLDITFRPIKPQAFYKRVFCLIHHQKLQYLDLIGVCIPRPYLDDHPIDFGVSAVDTILLPVPNGTSEEYFRKDMGGLLLSDDTFYFGQSHAKEDARKAALIPPAPLRKSLTVKSVLPYDVVMEWVPDPTQTFIVNPATAYVNKDGYAHFDISFHPQYSDKFYAGQLECYVYPTTYNWPSVGPPWVASTRTCEIGVQCVLRSFSVPAIASDVAEKPMDTEAVMREDTATQSDHLMDEPEQKKITITPPPEEYGEVEGYSDYIKPASLRGSNASTQASTQETKPTNLVLKVTLQNGAKICAFDLEAVRSIRVESQNTEPIEEIDLKQLCNVDSKDSIEYMGEVPGEDRSEPKEIQSVDNPKKKSKKKKGKSKSKSKKKGKSKSKSKKKGKSKSKSKSNKKGKSKSKSKSKKKGKSKSKSKSKKKNKKKSKSQSIKKRKSKGKSSSKKKGKSKSKSKGGKRGRKGKDKKRKEKQNDNQLTEEVLGEMPIGDQSIEEEEELVGDEYLDLEQGAGDAPVLDTLTMPDECEEEEDQSVGPTVLAIPLCITVRLSGMTYNSPSEPPIPHYTMQNKILLNMCFPQSISMGTLMIQNPSDLPLAFCVSPCTRGTSFLVKPTTGVIYGHDKQILVVAMKSKASESETLSQMFAVNYNFTDKAQFTVSGATETPKLRIRYKSASNDLSRFVFPPTLPHAIGRAEMILSNASRFQYSYYFQSVSKDEDLDVKVFQPDPFSGVVEPYEDITIRWQFIPNHFGKFKSPWVCTVRILGSRTDDSIGSPLYNIPLPLRGISTTCELKADPDILDFGTVTLYKEYNQVVKIQNHGNVTAVGKLFAYHEQWLQGFEPSILKISTESFEIGPMQSFELTVHVKADKIAFYHFFIDYCLGHASFCGDGPQHDLEEMKRKNLFQVKFLGKHPEIKISRIEQIARHPLWDVEQCAEMFQLARTNELLSPLNNIAPSGTAITSVPSIQWQLPSAVVGSLPSLFGVESSLSEDLVCAWELHTQPPTNSRLHQLQTLERRPTFNGSDLPKDGPKLLTYLWMQKYQDLAKRHGNAVSPTKSLAITSIQDAAFFTVTPTSGTLNCKDKKSIQIHIKFVYEQIGVYRKPILVRVYPAIFLWLDITAEVLAPCQPAFQLPEFPKPLEPVELNDPSPPIQVFQVYNGGEASITYSVDTEPFEELREANYDFDLVHSMTQAGEIKPLSWGTIALRFFPLEYTKYYIPIRLVTEVGVVERSLSASAWMDHKLRGPLVQTISSTSLFNPLAPVEVYPDILSVSDVFPLNQTITRILIVSNRSQKAAFSFTWPAVTRVYSTKIEIFPDIGVLSPGEKQICQVRITGGSEPHIVATSVRCWIEPDAVEVCAVSNARPPLSITTGDTSSTSPVYFREQTSTSRSGLSTSRLLHITARVGIVEGAKVSGTQTKRLDVSKLFGGPDEDGSPYSSESANATKRLGATVLSNFNSHLSEEILRSILWDAIMEPQGVNFINEVLSIRGSPPSFSDLKQRSQTGKANADKCSQVAEVEKQVLEFVLSTIMQEIVDSSSALPAGSVENLVKPLSRLET